MIYGIAFLIFAAACTAHAAHTGQWAWLLLWPAVSFLLVGAAYLGAGPALLGKRANGRIAAWAKVILFPYFLLSAAVWYAQRWFGSEDCHNQVAPGLWVGRRPFSDDVPEQVQLIVDMTAEFQEVPEVACNGREYHCLPTLDASVPDEQRVRDLVTRLAGYPGGIYIHCAQGRGRSAMLAAAVLIHRGQAPDADAAVALLRRARPTVHLSRAQRRLVARLAHRPRPGPLAKSA